MPQGRLFGWFGSKFQLRICAGICVIGDIARRKNGARSQGKRNSTVQGINARAMLLALAALSPAPALCGRAPAPSAPGAVRAQEQQRPAGALIAAPYRGRWAPSAAACQGEGPGTQAVQVSSVGWTSFESGSRVIAPGKVRRGTTYYQVRSFAAEGKSRPGTLALRLEGPGLRMSETVAGRAVHRHLLRCR